MAASSPSLVVTGGAGFLGSHLCDRLLADGRRVVCVDDLSTGREANLADAVRTPGFTWLRADVAGDWTVDEPVAAVLHLACPASPVDYTELPLETLRAGSLGTMNALELARRHGARFVLASSSEVYGDPLMHPQVEEYRGNVDPVGPRSMYDEAKRFGEAVTAAHGRAGVDTGIVRIFNTYGPRLRSNDGRVVPAFIDQALAGRPFTVAGDGRQTRSLCYVDDTVDALIRMASTAGPSGPLNIGNPRELTVRELASVVAAIACVPDEVTHLPRPPHDPEIRRPDISRARAELGWEPQVSLEEGLARTVAWFRDQTVAPEAS
jgi:dTDP-glucose 4,6-dehydratase